MVSSGRLLIFNDLLKVTLNVAETIMKYFLYDLYSISTISINVVSTCLATVTEYVEAITSPLRLPVILVGFLGKLS